MPTEPLWLLPPHPASSRKPTRSTTLSKAPEGLVLLHRFLARPATRSARLEVGSNRPYRGRKSWRSIGLIRDAVDAVVETVKSEVEPPAVGVRDVGASEHVGANGGVGDTEQLNDTGLLNPSIAVAVRVKTAEPPAFTDPLPGARLILKSGATTTWVKTTEVAALKVVSPL